MTRPRKQSANKPDVPAQSSERANGPETVSREEPKPAEVERASWSTDDILTIARTLRR